MKIGRLGKVAIAVTALGLLASVGRVILYPDFGDTDGRPHPRLVGMQLRRSVELWRGTHATEACPTLEQLREDKVIDPAGSTNDPWGTPFEITCEEDETIVRSLGPDRVRSGDDIVVPAPSAD